MKTALIAGGVVAAVLGGLYLVYRSQQPSDPGQQKQAAARMLPQPQPAPFSSAQLAYAPGASPMLTQIGQGLGIAGGAVDVAQKLGFFDSSGGDDDDGSA